MLKLKFGPFWWGIGILQVLVVWFLSLTSTPPQGPDFFWLIPFDKAGHFLAYFSQCIWFCFLLEKRFHARILIFFCSQGFVLEIFQYFSASRSWEIADIVANTLGALVPYLVLRNNPVSLFTKIENLILQKRYPNDTK